ncbi:MAG: DegT/DnrJ/EryC1/StrS aminotransferase [Caulobacteraceae bacterium]|nr:DegT/DnrJ/EryC1/StrS aminotransferase [Caulobacteraceae bacterium]
MRSLADSSLDFWLTTGPFNDAFEAGLAKRTGAEFAMTVNSGSSANLVAFSALTSPKLKARALKPGDEVITAATGFPTTVNPILSAGLVPVFVDMLPDPYNFDPAKVAEAITPKTKAIVAAHTLGNPFDLAAIRKLCDDHGLWLMEDCCDALGSTYDGKKVGLFGDIATLSFYPAHHITTGEGGAVFTNDAFLRRLAESFRDWGRDCYCAPGCDNTCGKRFGWKMGGLPKGYDHKFTYGHLGYNLKMTDMQASIGLAQLDHLDSFIAARKRNFATLKAGLADLQDILALPAATPNSDPSWFGFPITVKPGAPFSRNDLTQHLDAHKIGTRLLFAGNLVRQPYMEGRNFRVHGDLPIADSIMNNSFWIGVYPGLTPDHIAYMLETIHAFCRGQGVSPT